MKLYSYQIEGKMLIKKHQRVILADDMGLGKTAQILRALDEQEAFPCLVVVGLKFGFGVWETEIAKWTDKKSVTYTGKPQERKKIWDNWDPDITPFMITNTAMLGEILAKRRAWPALVFDEYHLMGLRNRKTKTYKLIKEKALSRYLILSSGSPVSQGPQDFFAPLNLLRPHVFPSYWKFVTKYCVSVLNEWGSRRIARYPRDRKVFKEMLKPYMIRRTKKQVLEQLPEKTRQILPVEMSRKQKTMYKKLANEMLLELDNGELVITPSVIAKITRLRQLLVSPRLLGDNEPGGALEQVIESVRSEFEAGNSVAVFTPYRGGVKEAAHYLSSLTPHVFTIMGQMDPQDVTDTIETFQTLKSHQKILICTIKSAVSFTAHAACAAFFLGYEWDHNDNMQAEDRLHRVGQKNAVRIYYFKHKDTIETRVLEVIVDKHTAAGLMLTPRDILPT